MKDKNRQEYKEEILSEVMICVNEWCRYGCCIDNVIIRDMCDQIRDDDNI